MKRSNNSDSVASALLTMYSSKEIKQSRENDGFREEFQVMLDRLDQEDCSEEASFVLEKKRRLSYDQVKALERNFELDNKLEPERKVQLAEELGLQPRQIAIWFQNRRARWKTKKLERDYGLLKSNFDALKLDCDSIEQENAALTTKVRELKAKLQGESAECNQSRKEESPISDLGGGKNNDQQNFGDRAASESNSNGVVKEESNVDCNESFPNSSSFINWFQLSDSKGSPDRGFQTQFMRMEDQNLFSINEFCNFFSVDQSPTL